MTLSRRECGRWPCAQVSGLLVLLGYAITGFTPAAYRRHRL